MESRRILQSLCEVLPVLLNVALVVFVRKDQVSWVDRVTGTEELELEYPQRLQLVGRRDCRQSFYQCPWVVTKNLRLVHPRKRTL